jgi:hypothetical protein
MVIMMGKAAERLPPNPSPCGRGPAAD